MPRVSVVVPVHDGARSLPALLAALAAQQDVEPFELLVVDNASSDDTAAVAQASPVVSRVVHEPRRGSYAARNAGWRTSSGEVVVFTDADCAPQPAWLSRLVAAVDEGADLAAGAVLPAPASAGDRASGRAASWGSWWASGWAGYDHAMYLDQGENVTRDGFAATASMAVRRAVLEELGGFDAALTSGGDLAFSRAAVAAGHRLVWVPDAVVLHEPRAGLRATWSLWRRLGRGWSDLAERGQWPAQLRRDPVLRKPFAEVRRRAHDRGVATPAAALAVAHLVARAAVLRGRLDRR